MKVRITTGLITVIIALSMIISCYSSRVPYSPANKPDYTSAYTPDKQKPLPFYTLENINDSVSRLHFKISSADLLYKRSAITNKLTAQILVSYTLKQIQDVRTIADSGHTVLNDINENAEVKDLSGYIDMDVPLKSEKYYIEVTFRDLNKMAVNYELISLEHNAVNARNNFMLCAPNSSTPLFRNYVDAGEPFRLQFYNKSASFLYVKYYKGNQDPARPPYSMTMAPLPVLYDSAWKISLRECDSFIFQGKGHYVISADSTQSGGFTIGVYYDGFPQVSTPKALLEPLRYITTKKEYTTLEISRNTKVAVDSFWISLGGNADRARELISAYYGRVEIANMHFTAGKEGWKTDRGMVYIIYGEPQNVYRSWKSETWVYGQDQSGNMLNFVFTRDSESVVDNDFKLERNQAYNVSWITAVDYWKQGQVYRAK
jgi:GWxTD domain-containing protein